MPVYLKLPLPGNATLALWRIDEEEEHLASLCLPAEREEAAAFGASRRRLEFLAWHALLHALVPNATAAYDAGGGPVLVFPPPRQAVSPRTPTEIPHRQAPKRPAIIRHENAPSENVRPENSRRQPLSDATPLQIGVSHSRGFAAIVLAPQRCAVDIERANSDFSRAARRFISPQELAMQPCVRPETLFPAMVWCAKETAYKWARQNGLSLLRDIRMIDIHPVGESALIRHATLSESPRSACSCAGGSGLRDLHRMTVSVNGTRLPLHGFTVAGMCCVYGIG